jgi:hypothetical protein
MEVLAGAGPTADLACGAFGWRLLAYDIFDEGRRHYGGGASEQRPAMLLRGAVL